MYTLATNIRNWGMKVVRRLNHPENQKKQKKPKEVHQKVGKTIEKTTKKRRFHAGPGGSTLGAHPGMKYVFFVFVCLYVFSMVLPTL